MVIIGFGETKTIPEISKLRKDSKSEFENPKWVNAEPVAQVEISQFENAYFDNCNNQQAKLMNFPNGTAVFEVNIVQRTKVAMATQ